MRESMPKDEDRVLALPASGRPAGDVLALAEHYAARDVTWRPGQCPLSGAVYMRDEEHSGLLNSVYAMYCHSNPLHAQKFPAVCRMEREARPVARPRVWFLLAGLPGCPPVLRRVRPAACCAPQVVAMAAGLVGGGEGTDVCGCITSGGTESILTERPLSPAAPALPLAPSSEARFDGTFVLRICAPRRFRRSGPRVTGLRRPAG